MTERDEWRVTPEAGYLMIERAFLGVIGEYFAARGAHDLAGEIRHAIATRQVELETSHGAWVVDEQSRYHLRLTALILAAFHALRAVLPPDDALALVRRAFIEPMRAPVRAGTAAALDAAPDPFALMTTIAKEREASFYGQAFTFDRAYDDDFAFLDNITHCFYHRFFAANDAPELTPIFCDWDTNSWAEAIDPARHGFHFTRPTTLGYGGDCCRFWFLRAGDGELGR